MKSCYTAVFFFNFAPRNSLQNSIHNRGERDK